jgi:hypothetical protein
MNDRRWTKSELHSVKDGCLSFGLQFVPLPSRIPAPRQYIPGITPLTLTAFASEGSLPAAACGWLPAQSKLRADSGLLRSVD